MSKVFTGFKNYGFWEWFALIVGVVISSRPVFQYVRGDYDYITSWGDTGGLIVPLGAFILGTVLMAAPRTVLGAFKSRFTKQSGWVDVDQDSTVDPTKPGGPKT